MEPDLDRPTKMVAPSDNSISTHPTPLPPTKQVEEILRLIQQLNHGKVHLESEWNKFKLRRADYSDLLVRIKKEFSLWGFVEDKLRYV